MERVTRAVSDKPLSVRLRRAGTCAPTWCQNGVRNVVLHDVEAKGDVADGETVANLRLTVEHSEWRGDRFVVVDFLRAIFAPHDGRVRATELMHSAQPPSLTFEPTAAAAPNLGRSDPVDV